MITMLETIKLKLVKLLCKLFLRSKGHYIQYQKNLLAVLEVIFQNSYYSLIELISSLANSSGVLIIGTYMGSLSTLIANLK